MAISKIGRNATDTGITDNSDSTAITISSAEVVDIELGDISGVSFSKTGNADPKQALDLIDIVFGQHYLL